jgi:hypothetical protein
LLGVAPRALVIGVVATGGLMLIAPQPVFWL